MNWIVIDDPLPALVLAEFEQALVVSYLTCNRHNYSHLLERSQQAVGPPQVHRAEEYIEQNWDQPSPLRRLPLLQTQVCETFFILSRKAVGCRRWRL